MGTGVSIAVAGVVMTLLAVGLLANYRGFGDKTARFGGTLTLMFGGGETLRRPRRASAIWGVILLIIGVAWVIGGIVLATK